jgi:hypothetical protein
MTAEVIRVGWGRAKWRRGHPSLGFVLHGPDAAFEHAGRAEPRARASRGLGGPLSLWTIEYEEEE